MAYLDRSYAPMVCAYLKQNKEHFRYSRGAYPEQYFTPERQALILEMESRRRSEGKGFHFYLVDKVNQSIFGDLHFNEIVRGAFQSCFVGYKVSAVRCGTGLMTEALGLTSKFVFDAYQLHRIEANIMPSNKASIRVAEKNGFHKEGLAKDFLKINGQWEDHFRYALLNHSFT